METKEQYLLEAKNLSKYFPVKNFFGKLVQEVRAVDRVNLSIKKGETFGLVGESGCGKSTLGRTLIRMYEPTDGILTYDGHDITKTKGKELLAYHKRMQIIFQDPYSALDPHQNVREIMAEPIAVFENLPEKEMDERAIEILKVFDLDGQADVLASNLPYGKQRKLEIARALATEPKLLLLDEPAAGMNPNETQELMDTIQLIREKFHITILLIEHDMKLVSGICEYLYVLNFGMELAHGEPTDVLNDPKVITAYLGE